MNHLYVLNETRQKNLAMNSKVDIKITGGGITGKILPSLNYNIPLITERHQSQELINMYLMIIIGLVS